VRSVILICDDDLQIRGARRRDGEGLRWRLDVPRRC
jgi:hypothetical protein